MPSTIVSLIGVHSAATVPFRTVIGSMLAFVSVTFTLSAAEIETAS